MNWFDECVVGVFPDWWKFQLAVCGLQLLGKSSRSLAWWEVPVNFPTWIEVLFHLVCLAVIMYQVYIYKDNKSTLKAG
jgi:cystinosin